MNHHFLVVHPGAQLNPGGSGAIWSFKEFKIGKALGMDKVHSQEWLCHQRREDGS